MFGFWFMSLSFSALNIGMSYHASVVRKSIMLLIDHMPFWCIVSTNTKGYLFWGFCFLIRWRINLYMNQVECFLQFCHVVVCLGIFFFAFACHLINDIVPYMIANARFKNLTIFVLWMVFFVLHYPTKQQNFDQNLDNIHDWIKIIPEISRTFIEKVDILQKWYPLFQPRHNLGVLAF